MGVYVVEPAVLERIQPGERMDFPDLVKALMADGQTVQTFETDEFWLDIGRHSDYEEALRVFPEMEEQFLGRRSEP